MKKTLAALAALLLLLSGCSRPVKRQASYFDVFDTQTTFTAYAKSQKEFDRYAEIVHGELLRLHKLFDIYNSYDGIGNLYLVNELAGQESVEVDASVIELLELAATAELETGGAVNCALGSVLRLWHDAREASLKYPDSAVLPREETLRAAADFTSMKDVVIDREGSSVFLRKQGMSLDVGAIAKGFAAQRAMDLAREAGMTSGLLNAGGNVTAVGAPLDGREAWNVGIQSPEDAGALWDTLAVSDCSAVTSGDYQRFYEVEGKSYHHIIDPWTLYPADKVRSVTVIHADGAVADILSTAAFILPYSEAEALVERLDGEAVWLYADGSSRCTEGYRAMSQERK